MQITETERGFSLAKFAGADGAECSIQDSSLATDVCIWLGVSRHADGSTGERMHLTQGMAHRLAKGLLSFRDGDEVPYLEFDDLYGNTCQMIPEGTRLRVGVTTTRNGQDAAPMLLGAETVAELMPLLLAFIESGTISMPSGRVAEEVLAPTARPQMDVKIPPSMLPRADIGETGVSAQELVDALCLLVEGTGEGLLREVVGYDGATDVIRLRDAVKAHWRNPGGTHAIIRS